MGQLIDGVWHDTRYDTQSTGGKFKRSVSAFRNWLTADGARRSLPVKVASPLRKRDTTCTFLSPARGRTAR